MFEVPNSERKSQLGGATSVVIDPRKGGSWVTSSGDGETGADYINSFAIAEFDPPNRMLLGSGKYYAGTNWRIKTNMTTEFIVEPVPAGCILRIVQELAPADPLLDDYSRMRRRMADSFEGIRNPDQNPTNRFMEFRTAIEPRRDKREVTQLGVS